MSHFLGIEVPPAVIHAACAGDARAHEAIYRACQRPIHTLIRRLILRTEIAEELFQETFVEILRNIGAYSGDGAFGGWVRAIAVNKCLMYLRSPWHRSLIFAMHARIDHLLSIRDGQPVEADIAEHVAQCAACSAEVRRLSLTREQLQALPQTDAAPAAWERIQSQMSRPRASGCSAESQ